jgi:5-(carboxyamino)imidazole ribonucleotide synthase
MSAQAAQQMGLRVIVLDSDPNCPGAQVTPFRVKMDWNSDIGAAELAQLASSITLENEWVSPSNLLLAKQLGSTVIPEPHTLSIIGDKFRQRTAFAERGLPSPRFCAISSWDDLYKAAENWGGKVVLKSRRGGYDGYGVKIVHLPINDKDLPLSEPDEWYAEEFVPFDRELAVIVGKNSSGETAIYPVVESRQTTDGHRCDVVIAPAPNVDTELTRLVQDICLSAVDAVEGIGLFGVELFSRNGEIIINEIAPRPHNSGHYTMDGCRTSQFEQHIRMVRNLPPGPTHLIAPVVVMANLLAPRHGQINLEKSVSDAYRICPNIHLHWYGKSVLREGRKMGHLNLLGDDLDDTLSLVLAARDAFWRGVP